MEFVYLLEIPAIQVIIVLTGQWQSDIWRLNLCKFYLYFKLNKSVPMTQFIPMTELAANVKTRK